MTSIPIRLNDEIIKKIDILIAKGRYKNRTEALRDQIIKGLDKISLVEDSVIEDTTEMIVPVEGEYFTFVKGVGKATSEKMVAAGYFSKEQVLNADDEDLKEEFNWSDSKVASIREQLEDAS